MNPAWWGRESYSQRLPGAAQPPLLLRGGRLYIRETVAARIADFTPEWSNARAGDAGYALLKLHAELAEPIVERLNRLPEKLLIEYLRTAGILPMPARPARALLAFRVTDEAPHSVLVSEGFQVSSRAADGSGRTVIFETERSLFATPGSIAQSLVQDGSRFYPIDLSDNNAEQSEAAFGSNPKPGAALLFGLDSKIAPQPSICLGIQLSAQNATPPPVAHGGIESEAQQVRPLLRWEFFDGGSFTPAEVIRDDSKSLQHSGIVELRCPRQWRPGTPAGVSTDQPLRWLRLKLVFGEFSAAPQLSFVRLNLVPAIAARTVRNEVLEYIADSDGRRLRLSQKPILADSLHLVVDEGDISNPDVTGDTTDGTHHWQQVQDLQAFGPDDRVYLLDAGTGELTFGDGVYGMILPRGFRHVIAERYQVASGSAGAVDAEQITGLVSSAPFLVAVSNPLPASGGRDQECLQQSLMRGPQKMRARDRAVTSSDYALLALSTPGADIRRAHAVSGIHAGIANARVPGTVSLFLLGPPRSDGPPYPDQGSLDAVSLHLAGQLAPAGVQVVAAAPPFVSIRVRASLVIDSRADKGDTIRQTLTALDLYFDPIVGGDQGQGWPFGGKVSHNALVRHLLARVNALQAVSTLNLVVAGENLPACSNYQPPPNTLLWPASHELREASL